MDENKIQELCRQACLANLDGTDFIAGFSDAKLAESYNGIGPEFLPSGVREKVTAYLSVFEPAALIHDMRYECSDGLRAAFDHANAEFLGNCLKLADWKYPWYNPRRYLARRVARILGKCVCGSWGWIAWTRAQSSEQKISGNSAGQNKE